MNKIASVLIGTAVLVFFSSMQIALAQYENSPYDANYDRMSQNAELARETVKIASQNPHAGSGTPFFDATGVAGSSLIVGTVLGGIATAFVVKSRRARQ